VTPLLQFLVILELCAAGATRARPELVRPDPIRAVQQDRWLAEDKLKHAFSSVAAVNFVYAGARTAGLHDESAIVAAAVSAAAAGIWKEVHDRRRGRPFSSRDLVWDAAGLTLGVILVSNAR
jgi:uncharacterized protein YfiM (DUF2279 family)